MWHTFCMSSTLPARDRLLSPSQAAGASAFRVLIAFLECLRSAKTNASYRSEMLAIFEAGLDAHQKQILLVHSIFFGFKLDFLHCVLGMASFNS